MTPSLLTLLAVFIAAAGYAVGRLHQWYRTGLERDDAYREGYDTAARSTFSMAARLAGPRRDRSGVRASAAVQAGRPAETSPRPSPPHAPSVLSPRPSGPSAARTAAAFFAPSAPPVTPPESADDVGVAASPAAPVTPPETADDVGVAASPAAPEPGPEPDRPGRHLVPDELVRAATYRLPPDRVARAKVHGAAEPHDPALHDPTPQDRVPRPRSS